MPLDWLQAHEKAGQQTRTVHKPSPRELPVGKARVRVHQVCTYDNRLVNPGEEIILRKCRIEFPRIPLKKEERVISVVINGESFQQYFHDGHMEYLGEIKQDSDGNETFVPYHGEPIKTEATSMTDGPGQPNGSQGNKGNGQGPASNKV